MFSGIVSNIGEIIALQKLASGQRLDIACDFPTESLNVGASMCCSGICLTITEVKAKSGRTAFTVDISPETLSLTPAALWQVGHRINLEQSLKMGDEIGGHFVFGHVDGLAKIDSIEKCGEMQNIRLCTPTPLANMLAKKGSVALDGVSLTINQVYPNGFSLTLIPHTLRHTTLGQLKLGDKCALEIDMLMRYAQRTIQTQKNQ